MFVFIKQYFYLIRFISHSFINLYTTYYFIQICLIYSFILNYYTDQPPSPPRWAAHNDKATTDGRRTDGRRRTADGRRRTDDGRTDGRRRTTTTDDGGRADGRRRRTICYMLKRNLHNSTLIPHK